MATSAENKADYWFRQAMNYKADAERWRWLTSDCDGNAQDDFTRWLAGHVASKADINAKIDEAMTVVNKQEKNNIAVFGAYTETNNQEAHLALDKTVPNA